MWVLIVVWIEKPSEVANLHSRKQAFFYFLFLLICQIINKFDKIINNVMMIKIAVTWSSCCVNFAFINTNSIT